MGLSQALLPEFDHEMAGTRKTLERVPEGQLAWRPHAKSMTLGGLASHLANLPSWIGYTVERDSLDLAPVGQPALRQEEKTSRQALLDHFDRHLPRDGRCSPPRPTRLSSRPGRCSGAGSRTSPCRASPCCAAS